MKIKHRVPTHLIPMSDVVTPEYQAEVDLTMARAEAAFKRAQRRLEKAEAQLAKAERSRNMRPRQLDDLRLVVAARHEELARFHRLMASTGVPSTSRGKKSHRHVSTGEAF